MAQVLCPVTHAGDPSSCLWPDPPYHGHLESEPGDGRSLSLSLSFLALKQNFKGGMGAFALRIQLPYWKEAPSFVLPIKFGEVVLQPIAPASHLANSNQHKPVNV